MGKKHKDRPKHQHYTKYHEPPANQFGGELSMIYTVKIQPHPEEENRYTEEKTYRQNQLNVAKRLNLITGVGGGIALLTLIALIAYACITYRQLETMKDSNTINREGVESVQRAFVYLSNLAAIFPNSNSPDGDKVLFQADWQNSGSTPATSVIQWVSSDWRNRLLPYKEFNYPDKPADESIVQAPTQFYIAPHDHERGSMLKVPRTELGAIGAGTFVHFWGWITYIDAFKHIHRSEFCFRIIAFDPKTPQILMAPCPEHNCADEDCKDYKTPAKAN